MLSEGGDFKDCETGDASFGGGGGGGAPRERIMGGGGGGPGERTMVCELFVTCGLRGDG